MNLSQIHNQAAIALIPVKRSSRRGRRRASEYLKRAAKLTEDAQRIRDAADRQHMLDLAEGYARGRVYASGPAHSAPGRRSRLAVTAFHREASQDQVLAASGIALAGQFRPFTLVPEHPCPFQ
jgi:hypothetical protein